MCRQLRSAPSPVTPTAEAGAPARRIPAMENPSRSTRTRSLLLCVPGLLLAVAWSDVPADDEGEPFLQRCLVWYADPGESPPPHIVGLCGCMSDLSASGLTADEREMLLLSVTSPPDTSRMVALGEDVMESMSGKIEAACT